jgi:hypothetical protein
MHFDILLYMNDYEALICGLRLAPSQVYHLFWSPSLRALR